MTVDNGSNDNGRELANEEFEKLNENFNIGICTTAADSLCNNGLIERDNANLGLTITKTIEKVKSGLDMDVAWAISATNTFKNKNRYSPNQLLPQFL